MKHLFFSLLFLLLFSCKKDDNEGLTQQQATEIILQFEEEKTQQRIEQERQEKLAVVDLITYKIGIDTVIYNLNGDYIRTDTVWRTGLESLEKVSGRICTEYYIKLQHPNPAAITENLIHLELNILTVVKYNDQDDLNTDPEEINFGPDFFENIILDSDYDYDYIETIKHLPNRIVNGRTEEIHQSYIYTFKIIQGDDFITIKTDQLDFISSCNLDY